MHTNERMDVAKIRAKKDLAESERECVCVRVPGLPRLAGSLIRSDSLWCPPSARCTSLHTRTHTHTHYVPGSDIAEQGWRNAEEKMRAGWEWGMKCRGKKRGTLLSSSVSGRTEIFPWHASHREPQNTSLLNAKTGADSREHQQRQSSLLTLDRYRRVLPLAHFL